MSPEDARSTAILEARCRDRHAAMCLAREVLIEMLGDFMCGGGESLSPEALWAFEEAVFMESTARRELKSHLIAPEKNKFNAFDQQNTCPTVCRRSK